MTTHSLHIIIVTYNNRWASLLRVLRALAEGAPGSKVIVVNNGSDLQNQPNWTAEVSMELKFIHSKINRGSAWAFGQGLHLAKEQGAGLILLLDDDNLIDGASIKELINTWELLKRTQPHSIFALMALREDRRYLRNVAKGGSIKSNFPELNDFLGFSMKKAIAKIFGKKHQPQVDIDDLITIPCAPYGGLLIEAETVEQIGIPDERFFVYADDFEYTHRITARGGTIFLVRNSRVTDITESWNHKSSGAFFKHKFLFPANDLIYMSIRNFVYFQYAHLTSNKLVFGLNRLVFTLYLLILAIFTLRLKHFRKYLKAVRDGVEGVIDNQQYLNY